MTRTRYTTSARLTEKDVHRWVFANNIAPDVETLVRKWPFCLDDLEDVDDMEGGVE